MSATDVAVAFGASVAGLALGAAFYSSLRSNVRLYLARGGMARVLGGALVQLLRVGLAVAALVALARVSPVAFAFALAGFTVSGVVLGRRAGEAKP